MVRPVRRNQKLIWQIDCQFNAAILTQLPPKIPNDALGEGGDENSILNAIDLKYFAKAWSDQSAYAEIEDRKRRPLARRAAAKIDIGDENLGVAVSRVVQHKIGAWPARFVETKIVQKGLAIIVTRTSVPAHEPARKDHAGVDFCNFERRRDCSQGGEGGHLSLNCQRAAGRQ